ncbi:MAG: DUF4422 domain-containing protein [Bacteroidota bacterium]
MYNKELTIFSVFHKDYPQPNCDFIKPIQVGKGLTELDLGFLKDNIGPNISSKNPYFCELTALYWIWKNLDQIESEFIGLAHYRRYFVLPERVRKNFGFLHIYKKNKRDVYQKALSENALTEVSSEEIKLIFIKKLRENTVIVPRPAHLGSKKKYDFNIKDNYIYNHILEDWLLLEAALVKICPEYSEFAKEYFETAEKMHCYNMFIGSKTFLANYCDWLFPILEELERTVKLSEYPYQKRVFGFIAERLLNLYLHKNNLNTTVYPVVFFN